MRALEVWGRDKLKTWYLDCEEGEPEPVEPQGFLSWASGWVAMPPTITGLTAEGTASGEPGRR